MSSRWANSAADAAADAARKKEKEEKKRARLEKQRLLEARQQQRQGHGDYDEAHDGRQPPAKRRRLSDATDGGSAGAPRKLLRFAAPGWAPCRSVDGFEKLNDIEEGSYGWVSRAREAATGEVVALKKLKMGSEAGGGAAEGFPVTALREIQALKEARHRHVVELREVVVGSSLNDVFLVMEFLEHDLRTLQEDMAEPFMPSEIKTLLLQLASAVEFLHDHWILHRDLKTSNILMNNRGVIKLADFGMARYTSSPPPPNLTQLVVTLWYRAPELLLGATTYDASIDMWSVGCIFGELLTREPLLQGKNEVSQLSAIFGLSGVPTETSWPTFRRLPHARALRLPARPAHPRPPDARALVRARFPALSAAGAALLAALLSLDPAARPSAADVRAHPYFREDPRPKSEAMFPTFPSKAGQEKRRRRETPEAPRRGAGAGLGGLGGLGGNGAVDFSGIFGGGAGREDGGKGWGLKMV
ncbi:kinase-like domain-containing protein [Lineolata rhizophorae]|uniref:cyclin-dependent kinase n=1 Tax=Lineolata rhizophorae TaxID=578093 RepID=A0A6A6P3F5_9PEZI|nr:kinase-like domain-containing protein [Lineolata rhizophorae]